MLAHSLGFASLSCTVSKAKDPATRQERGTKQDVSMRKIFWLVFSGAQHHQAFRRCTSELASLLLKQRGLYWITALPCRPRLRENHPLLRTGLACMEKCYSWNGRSWMRTCVPVRLAAAHSKDLAFNGRRERHQPAQKIERNGFKCTVSAAAAIIHLVFEFGSDLR